MLQFIAEHFYIIPALGILFMLLYFIGGEDIVFFRKKRYAEEPKSQERLMSAVNRFARSHRYKVYGRTTVEFEGERHTYDAIRLTLFGTILFSANPRGGDIYGDATKENWAQHFMDKRIEFPNPLNEMRGSGKFFRDIYRKENVKAGQTENVVVFTNRTVAVAVPKTLPVYKSEDLQKSMENKKFLTDNGADMAGMKAALDKYIVKE